MTPSHSDRTESTQGAPEQPVAASPQKVPAGETMVHAMRRSWLFALVLGLAAGAIGGVAVSLFLPRGATDNSQVMSRLEGIEVQLTSIQEAKVFTKGQGAQMVLIKSRPVLMAALHQPKVAELSLVKAQPDPLAWLEEALKSDCNVSPDVLRLSLKGDKPEELVTLVDAVTDAYLQEVVDKENRSRTVRLHRLEDIYNTFDKTLQEKRQTLNDLAKSTSVKTTDDARLMGRLQAVEVELTTQQLKLTKLEVEYQNLRIKEKNAPDQEIAAAVIEEHLAKDPLVDSYKIKIAQAETKLADIARTAADGKDSPEFRQVQRDVETVKKALAARMESLRPAAIKEIREINLRKLHTEIQNLQERIVVMREQIKVLNSLSDRLVKETKQINEPSPDLQRLKEEIDHSQDMIKKVTAQMEQLRIELQAPPRITKLESATAKPAPDRKGWVAVAQIHIGEK